MRLCLRPPALSDVAPPIGLHLLVQKSRLLLLDPYLPLHSFFHEHFLPLFSFLHRHEQIVLLCSQVLVIKLSPELFLGELVLLCLLLLGGSCAVVPVTALLEGVAVA